MSIISTAGFPGLLRLGTIQDYNPDDYSVTVSINTGVGSPPNVIKAQLPIAFYSSNGLFAGGLPAGGTPCLLQQAEGGTYYIVNIIVNNFTSKSINSLNRIPDLAEGEFVIQASEDNIIRLNLDDGIFIGNKESFINADAARDLLSDNYGNKFTINEAFKEINGTVKRDLEPNLTLASSLRLGSHEFEDSLFEISLDPTISASSSNIGNSIKNPPFVERREVVYEFANSYTVLDDAKEINSYKTSQDNDTSAILNRRQSRADILSLSLVEPNYLMETVKGTVVDIYGNLVDINRAIIPIGDKDNVSGSKIKETINNDNNSAYKNIRALERKSLAVHLEINARKDVNGPPDINSQDDYARLRSRLFFDIDKEGLMKMNIPASSEVGNVPLLTRYENYTTVFPNEKTNDPNDLIFNDDNLDILIESFSFNNGVIKLADGDSQDGYGGPKDRFSDGSVHIGHGIVYHNVLETVKSFQDYSFNSVEYEPTTSVGLKRFPLVSNVVSPIITISGNSANAGGRSGSWNFDGSMEWNFGANTVDRQSLWVNTQGGVVGHYGRDKKNISAAWSMDGDLFIEIGGPTANKDSRFTSLDNTHRAATLAINIYNSNTNEVSVIRVDGEGFTLSTPAVMNFYANQAINIRSKADMNLEAENLFINRRVVRKFGGAI